MDFFTIRVMCCNFLNLYGRYVLQYKSFLTIFFLKTQQIEVRLVAIKTAFFIALSLYPLLFFANTPFKETHQLLLQGLYNLIKWKCCQKVQKQRFPVFRRKLFKICSSPSRHSIQNRTQKSQKLMPTALSIPRGSPIQVLT